MNKEIDEDIGDIFNRVSAPFNGHWMFFDKTIILKKGDMLHYWVGVYHDKVIQKKKLLSYVVTGKDFNYIDTILSLIVNNCIVFRY